MTAPSRNVRRRLKRRADRVLARVQNRLRNQGPLSLAPSEHVAVAFEPEEIVILGRNVGCVTFDAYRLGDLLIEIDAARAANPFCLPVVIVIAGWAQAAWLPLTPLSVG